MQWEKDKGHHASKARTRRENQQGKEASTHQKALPLARFQGRSRPFLMSTCFGRGGAQVSQQVSMQWSLLASGHQRMASGTCDDASSMPSAGPAVQLC